MSLEQEIKFPNGKSYKQPLGLFINNEFVAAKNGNTIETINPTTEEPICKVQAADSDDIDVAVKAARQAFKSWKKVPGYERTKLIRKLADLVDENRVLLSSIDALDSGKPRETNCINDIEETLDVLHYSAGHADKVNGEMVETHANKFAYTKRVPYGVCGQIIPWNYPIAMASWKLGPALATGNCCVMKTSEVTPLSMLYFCKLVKEAGFPPGVVNIVSGYGKDAGAALASHMDVDKIAFTGSTATGRLIMKAAALSNLKAVTLECGGKSPNVVFDDCDFEQAVKWSLFGIMYNQGQICSATSRIYVQEGIYEKFLEAIKKESQQTSKIGDPFDDTIEHGPQVNKQQFTKVLDYIKQGKESNARLILGGNRYGDKGYYVEPTIFADVAEDDVIMKDEIFGPVVCISKFTDEEDAINKANNTDYGLGASVFTENLSRAHRVAEEIEAGTVWVNSSNDTDIRLPFGGFKQSGISTELGTDGLKAYTQVKAIHMNMGNKL